MKGETKDYDDFSGEIGDIESTGFEKDENDKARLYKIDTTKQGFTRSTIDIDFH